MTRMRAWQAVVAALVTGLAYAPPGREAVAGGAGERLFQAKCRGCHVRQPLGEGDLLDVERAEGPDLSYAGSRLRAEWLESWLVTPSRLRPAGWLAYRYVVPTADGDRVDVARLPAHPVLPAAEAREVAGYLSTLRRELNPYPVAAPNTTIRAQVHFSKLLPCGGCHQARPGQGGVSGPELYTAGARLDREWMAAYIIDPGYWQKGLMPRADARGDQVAAIANFLAQPAATPAAAPLESPEPLVAAAPVPEPKGRAQRLYRLLCSQCHGVLGNGRGINARHLFVAPRNHRSAQEMSGLTREGVITAIRSGGQAVGKSAVMPAWGAVLERADIELLADHVLTLSGEASSPREGRVP